MVVEGGYALKGAYTDNINANPNFNKIGSDDYCLSGNSPCINKGKPDIGLLQIGTNCDLLGNNRIYDNKMDMGAIEYQGFITKITDKFQPEISVFPNPSDGCFTVFLPDKSLQINKIEIVNSLGYTIREFNDLFPQDYLNLDLKGVSPGMYFLKFDGARNFGSIKIIIQ